MKNTLFILIIAFIYPSYLEFESQISSNIDYVSTDINDNSGISIAYNHNILKSGYFSLYAGISYTASPLKFENLNLYSLDSDLGIITQCNDIVDPIDTEVYIGYIFIKPQYKTSDKFSLWFSLGINIFDVNYLQITHPYQKYNFVCDNCDDDNYDNDIEYYVLADQCEGCAASYENISSFGGMGFGIGMDFLLTDKISLSIGKYSNNNKNIAGYDVSVFQHENFDLDISRYVFSFKYHFIK